MGMRGRGGSFAEGGMAGSPAQNGAIPNSAAQSMVPQTASPTNGHAIDDVPAKLTAGEFVLPKDVVSWKGEEFLQNFLQKSREAIAQSKQQPQGQPKLAPKGAIPQAPTYASPGPR